MSDIYQSLKNIILNKGYDRRSLGGIKWKKY